MKKILSIFAVLALMASQKSFTQAKPAENSARSFESLPPLVFMPDAVSLLNHFTMATASGGLGVDAAFDPVQDDTTPPRITFVPPTLTLFPDPFSGIAEGNIVSVSFDSEVPFIVAVGAASAFGNGSNVIVTDFLTFFDLVNITLPGGAIEVGIGFIAAAHYVGIYDPFFNPICPCGGMDVAAVDFAGNAANGFAPVIVVSF